MEQKSIEIATSMIKNNYDIEEITKLTGLTKEDVLKLKDDIK